MYISKSIYEGRAYTKSIYEGSPKSIYEGSPIICVNGQVEEWSTYTSVLSYHLETCRWIDGRLESYALKWTRPMINTQIKRISMISKYKIIYLFW